MEKQTIVIGRTMYKSQMTFLALLGASALAAVGCGSSSSSSASKTSAGSAASTTSAATANASAATTATATSAATATRATSAASTNSHLTAGGVSVTSGQVRATLTVPNHTPTVGKLWPYAVHVTDVSGKRLNGTVDIQFAYGGQVVGRDTPPTHPIKNGLWHDNLTFPAAAVGQPITFQAVVHTSAGSVTLNWPVKVKS
jgi:hypothetical protein